MRARVAMVMVTMWGMVGMDIFEGILGGWVVVGVVG